MAFTYLLTLPYLEPDAVPDVHEEGMLPREVKVGPD